MMIALACIICLASVVNAQNIKTVRVSSVFEDHVVIQDVTDDPERNTVLIIVGNVDDYEDFKSTVNLHDFNAKYVALKDVNDGTCLLKPLTESKREHIPGLQSSSEIMGQIFTDAQKTMYWFRHPKVLDYEKVKRQAGEAVAAFCRDYKTYNLIPKDANSRKIAKELSDKGYRRMKRCSKWCGFCGNVVDGFEEDIVDLTY